MNGVDVSTRYTIKSVGNVSTICYIHLPGSGAKNGDYLIFSVLPVW